MDLLRLAPNSPAINAIVRKLSATLQQQESSKKQIEIAKQKYDQGVAAYNQKNYPAAIELLSQSFSLNPEPEATKAYLQLAQQQLVM